MNREELIADLTGRIHKLYLAELLRVSDFVKGIEMARNFLNQ